MQLNAVIHRNSFLFFLLMAGIFVLGFWPSFFAHPLSLKSNMHYIHAIGVSLWLLLLISQPLLIRMNLRSCHRTMGKISYYIFPVILVSSWFLIQSRQHDLTEVDDFAYGFLFLIMQSTLIFGTFYGLAMYYRKDPARHSRWMICTPFPLLPSATDRILARTFTDDPLFAMYTGWAVADLILLALSIWDWRSHKRLSVFPMALVVMVYHHTAWYFIGQLSAWREFAVWFAASRVQS